MTEYTGNGIARLRKALKEAINELEHAGYCFDHPSLVEKRAVLEGTESEDIPPDYECENCIGMTEHGCYCKAMGATAPGGPAVSFGVSDLTKNRKSK